MIVIFLPVSEISSIRLPLYIVPLLITYTLKTGHVHVIFVAWYIHGLLLAKSLLSFSACSMCMVYNTPGLCFQFDFINKLSCKSVAIVCYRTRNQYHDHTRILIANESNHQVWIAKMHTTTESVSSNRYYRSRWVESSDLLTEDEITLTDRKRFGVFIL
jgi:hypothetical protein